MMDNSPMLSQQQPTKNGNEPMLGGNRRKFIIPDGTVYHRILKRFFRIVRHEGIEAWLDCKEFYPNGYGISIMTSPDHYCEAGLSFEVAVLIGNAQEWDICYRTPITNDVMGWQSANDVLSIIDQIKALPQATDDMRGSYYDSELE